MENTENNKRKKTIVSITIGIMSLIILVLGAAYAYWTANTAINFNTATITYETGDEAIVILNGTSAELTLGILSPDDMAKLNKNAAYYASATGKKTTPTEETVGIATPYNEGDINSYRCTFTLAFTHSGTEDLIDRFLGETNDEPNYANRSAGQVFITVNGVEYDINDGFPSTITGTVYANQSHPGEIKVGFKFVNLSGVNQTYLANSNGTINVDLANNGFSCEVIGNTEYAYWTWESDDDYTTSSTARNKVNDYHELTLGTRSRLDIDVNEPTMYNSLDDCKDELNEIIENGVSNYQNLKCQQATTNYSILTQTILYDSESDCLDSGDDCTYNSTTEKWEAISDDVLIFSNQQDCEDKIDFLEPFYESVLQTPVSMTCTHPSSSFYYISLTRSTFFDSLTECNNIAELLNFNDINDLIENEELLSDYIVLLYSVLVGQNIRCESQLIPVFVRENEYLTGVASATDNKWMVYQHYYGNYLSLDECNADKYEGDICVPTDNKYAIDFYYTDRNQYDTSSDCNDYLSNNGNELQYCLYHSDLNKYVVHGMESGENSVTEAQCQEALNSVPNNVVATCVNANYVLQYTNSSWDTFSSESDCNSYLDNNGGNYFQPSCKYDSSNDEYLIYDIVPMARTQSSCQSLLSTAPSGVSGTCNVVYAILYPNNGTPEYDSLDACNASLENINSEYNPVCQTKYQNGEMLYNNGNEICGLVDNNLLCFDPYLGTVEEFIELMESYDGWLDYDYENGVDYETGEDYEAFTYGTYDKRIVFYNSKSNRYYYIEDYYEYLGCGLSGLSQSINCYYLD